MKRRRLHAPVAWVICVSFFCTSHVVQAAATHATPAYAIDLTLQPAQHAMNATTTIDFPAPAIGAPVEFRLNAALHVSQITDANGAELKFAREGKHPDRLQITPNAGTAHGDSARWTFHYSGQLSAPTGSSAQTAYIGEPTSYLLPAADWLPKPVGASPAFHAEITIHAPTGLRIFASGATADPNHFVWNGAGVPGLVVAGHYAPQPFGDAALPAFSMTGQGATALSKSVLQTAQKAYHQFAAAFGPLPWKSVALVPLPAGASSAAAPGLVVYPASSDAAATQNAIVTALTAEWWQNIVQPARREDVWITDGMTRMAELEFARKNEKPSEFLDTVENISASAIAYSTLPLLRLGEVPQGSPQFNALAYDKGGMIFRMLRWQIGEQAFDRTVHAMLAAPDGLLSGQDVERMAETASGKDLQPFFAQWLGSAQIPALKNTWTLYRLQAGGYQLVGSISQTTDLFQMPVALTFDASSGPVQRRIWLRGAATSYSTDCKQPPRKIRLDPDHKLLRTSPAMQVRAAIILGMNDRSAGDLDGAATQFRKALQLDPQSSLASYRLGETLMLQQNDQGAADAFRAALRGDGAPAWTQVWSDLKLGMLFDALGERERAVNQYRQALQTNDDTGGALSLARKYLQAPYQPAGKGGQ
jgi:tetratricopeptide (TPR) repeat protein